MPLSDDTPKKISNLKEELSWQIREKELEISHILSKTSFWHQQVDPVVAKEILRKEDWLTNWYESRKKQASRKQSFLQWEKQLKIVEREISGKRSVINEYYEKIGSLSLDSYQKFPEKWQTYENIFDDGFSKLSQFKKKEEKMNSLVYSFLHSNFQLEKEIPPSLKRILRSIGEKIMQLNLGHLVYNKGNKAEEEQRKIISQAEHQERAYTRLIRKKRDLETDLRPLRQEFSLRYSFLNSLKKFLRLEKDPSPKSIMLELEVFYTNLLKEYLEAVHEKPAASLEQPLKELGVLLAQKASLEKEMSVEKQQGHLKGIQAQKEEVLKKLERFKSLVKEQEEALANLSQKEKEIQQTLDSLKDSS
jgi:hypothetical protein